MFSVSAIHVLLQPKEKPQSVILNLQAGKAPKTLIVNNKLGSNKASGSIHSSVNDYTMFSMFGYYPLITSDCFIQHHQRHQDVHQHDNDNENDDQNDQNDHDCQQHHHDGHQHHHDCQQHHHDGHQHHHDDHHHGDLNCNYNFGPLSNDPNNMTFYSPIDGGDSNGNGWLTGDIEVFDTNGFGGSGVAIDSTDSTIFGGYSSGGDYALKYLIILIQYLNFF